jgi:hypothetical protein
MSLLHKYATLYLHQLKPWQRYYTGIQHLKMLQQRLRHFRKIALAHGITYVNAAALFDQVEHLTIYTAQEAQTARPDNWFIGMVREMKRYFRLVRGAEVEMLPTHRGLPGTFLIAFKV